MTGGRFARQKPPSNSTSAPTTATATAQPAASRRRLRHAQAHNIHSYEIDRKPSAHGRDASSMRTTATKRQSSLELTHAVSRLLDGIHLGEVDLDEVRPPAGAQSPFRRAWAGGETFRGALAAGHDFQAHLSTVCTAHSPQVRLQCTGGPGGRRAAWGHSPLPSSRPPGQRAHKGPFPNFTPRSPFSKCGT